MKESKRLEIRFKIVLMNTKITTNKILVRLEHETITERFDFFVIETDDKYIKSGSYILDVPSMNNSVKSIVFESGRRAFLMMEKQDNNRSILKKVFSEIEDGSGIAIVGDSIRDVPEHLLIQLLLNALSTYDSNLLKFNNLTGHLYCFNPSWMKHGKDNNTDVIWKVPCLEFSVTKDSYIKMQVRTFTSEYLKKKISFNNKKYEDYPKYVFSKDNTLRRRLSKDNDAGFIMRQVDGTKTDIPFLSIQNIEKFNQSKVGTLYKVIETFNSVYDGLAHLSLSNVNVATRIEIGRQTAKENQELIKGELIKSGIHIVDQICDNYSNAFCDELIEIVYKKYGVKATRGRRIKKSSLNICVVHNAEYYDGENDPYRKEYVNVAVQHVTLEDFASNAEYAISSVVHEVLIKKDLAESKISLFDWTKLGVDEDILFGIEKEIDDVNRYFFMRIHPDGSFEIKEQEFTIFEMNEYTECVNIFEDAKTKGEIVKGIIKNQRGQINIIKDTGIITLPEMAKISELLAEGDNKLRGKNRRDELLASLLDIKTYEEAGKLFYFVGTIGEGMRWSIPRAANIRCIERYEDATIMFEKLLATMSVTFVHNGQLTVLPFPFKYLREYVLKHKY